MRCRNPRQSWFVLSRPDLQADCSGGLAACQGPAICMVTALEPLTLREEEMDYRGAIEAFFQPAPEGTGAPRPVVEASLARRLRDAIEPLATHAFWNRLTNERNQERGLDFLTGYVWGRASALGEPLPGVVVSAFAWFEPGLADPCGPPRARCPAAVRAQADP